jgi:hypothetical protein
VKGIVKCGYAGGKCESDGKGVKATGLTGGKCESGGKGAKETYDYTMRGWQHFLKIDHWLKVFSIDRALIVVAYSVRDHLLFKHLSGS